MSRPHASFTLLRRPDATGAVVWVGRIRLGDRSASMTVLRQPDRTGLVVWVVRLRHGSRSVTTAGRSRQGAMTAARQALEVMR